MENSEFLWQSVSVALVVGNVLQAWLRIKSHGKPQQVDVANQPFEVIPGSQPATMDHIKVIHKRINGVTERLDKMDKDNRSDKQDIVNEIITLRKESHAQFENLSRAIGRLEGSRLSGPQ